MATCRVCRGEYNSEHHSCPRCGTEVARNVIDGDLDQIDFYLSWLIISVLLITAVTTLIWFMLYRSSVATCTTPMGLLQYRQHVLVE